MFMDPLSNPSPLLAAEAAAEPDDDDDNVLLHFRHGEPIRGARRYHKRIAGYLSDSCFVFASRRGPDGVTIVHSAYPSR